MNNNYLAIYLLVINLWGLGDMACDKYKSRKGLWRIPERHFIIIGLLGGSLGLYLGMGLFRHKTRHKLFTFGIPFLLILNFLIIYAVIKAF